MSAKGPQHEEILTDDYVAKLLEKDAKAVSSRASAGFEAYKKRPAGAAPKPNTRFLRTVIRNVDSHNSALKEREAEESRAKLEALHPRKRKHRREEQQLYSVRSRRDHGEAGLKRRRVDEVGQRHGTRAEHGRQPKEKQRSPTRTEKGSMGALRGHGTGRGRQALDHSRQGTNRERSNEGDGPGAGSGRPEGGFNRRNDSNGGHRDGVARPNIDSDADQAEQPGSDSEASIGPRRASQSPPVQRHGRGISSSTTTMDRHFSSAYDPSADVRLSDGEGDDWDQALEALRDRQKWRQNGADRLKAAGFSDAEVKKWEGGREGGRNATREPEVKWAKKGEDREWDKGKVPKSTS